MFAELLPHIEKSLASVRCKYRSKQPAQVAIHLIDDSGMAELNARYRQVKDTTDVLSFAYWETGLLGVQEELVGEIFIALPQAVRQAKRYGHALHCELALLAVHGALHILGYDHESGAAAARKMLQVEKKVLSQLPLQGVAALGLIDRTWQTTEN